MWDYFKTEREICPAGMAAESQQDTLELARTMCLPKCLSRALESNLGCDELLSGSTECDHYCL